MRRRYKAKGLQEGGAEEQEGQVVLASRFMGLQKLQASAAQKAEGKAAECMTHQYLGLAHTLACAGSRAIHSQTCTFKMTLTLTHLVQVVHGAVIRLHELVLEELGVSQVPPPPAFVQGAAVAGDKRARARVAAGPGPGGRGATVSREGDTTAMELSC